MAIAEYTDNKNGTDNSGTATNAVDGSEYPARTPEDKPTPKKRHIMTVPHGWLTVRQLSKLFHVPRIKLIKLAQEKKIEGRKYGGYKGGWIINQKSAREYLLKQLLSGTNRK
jgi:hypothetical protein